MNVTTNNIQRLLYEKEMSQEQLAQMVGYKGRGTINKILNGENKMSVDTLEKIAKALGTTPVALMGGDEDNIPFGNVRLCFTETKTVMDHIWKWRHSEIIWLNENWYLDIYIYIYRSNIRI